MIVRSLRGRTTGLCECDQSMREKKKKVPKKKTRVLVMKKGMKNYMMVHLIARSL